MSDYLDCVECNWVGYIGDLEPKQYEQYRGDTSKSYHCPSCGGCCFNRAERHKIKCIEGLDDK